MIRLEDINITVQDLKSLLKGQDAPILLDVRPLEEIEAASFPKYLNIVLNELPHEYEKLPKDKKIIVVCHHGNRSLHASIFLRAQGYENVLNLAGGIDAWSREIDPKVPIY